MIKYQLEPTYGGRRVVFPSGDPKAPVYIVGKFPSLEETQSGENMVGADGRTVMAHLEKHGVGRGDCRISNTCWVTPPGKELPRLKDIGLHPLFFKRELFKDIMRYPRSVIIAVGAEALEMLTGESGILKRRGSILPFSYDTTIPVVATILPSFLRKGNLPMVFAFSSDLRKAVTVSRVGYQKPERTFIHHSGGATFNDFKLELMRLAETKGLLAYDIEGWYPALTCISFSDNPSRAISIPLNNIFPEWQEDELRELVKKVLLSTNTGKVAHNMLFDNPVLAMWGIGVKNIFMDTMLAHHTIFQDLPHGLHFLTSMYTWEPYYKDDRTLIDMAGKQVEADEYSCKDSAVCLECVEPLLAELVGYNQTEFFFDEIMPRVKSASLMQSYGLPVLEENRLELLETSNKESTSLDDKLSLKGVNPHSHKSTREYLYDELGLKRQYNRKTKRQTTDDEALRILIQMYPLRKELLLDILNARKARKEISTYLEAEQDSGRFFYSVNIGPRPTKKGYIGGTPSGRYSMGKLLDGSGIPAQGIPKKLRYMIGVAKPLVIWECDASQAEARVVAWRAGEEFLIEAFLRGEDVHSQTASLLLDLPLESITKESTERRLAKTIKHATNYWIGPRQLQAVVRKDFPGYIFSYSDSRRFIERLRTLYPKTYEWGCAIERRIEGGDRLFRNCFGRLRYLLGAFNQDLVRTAISVDPQSTVADLVIIAKRKCQEEFKHIGRGVYIFNQVHDSIVGVCLEDDIQEVKAILVKHMEIELPSIEFKGIPLSIPAEFSIGANWRDLVEVK